MSQRMATWGVAAHPAAVLDHTAAAVVQVITKHHQQANERAAPGQAATTMPTVGKAMKGPVAAAVVAMRLLAAVVVVVAIRMVRAVQVASLAAQVVAMAVTSAAMEAMAGKHLQDSPELEARPGTVRM